VGRMVIVAMKIYRAESKHSGSILNNNQSNLLGFVFGSSFRKIVLQNFEFFLLFGWSFNRVAVMRLVLFKL